ncbi:hypothetical protein [uncultured Algibacter sp.]|uniref:hypothetical protein n=1 Tax=uncultured Algibacter sp. TaxID=298659 RepID=UPI00261BBF89|nr:hypothetical protein [uncultured Algibacter sp.]
MKKVIFLAIFITTFIQGNSQVQNTTLQINQDSTIYFNGSSKIDNSRVSKRYSLLSHKICSYYVGNANEVAEKTKSAIKNHLIKYENIINPTTAQMIAFLNKNKNCMTCGDDNKHYMMVSFDHGNAYNQLFNVLYLDEFLTEDENYIDVNGISYTGANGTPITVLDYMYKRVGDPNINKTLKAEITDLMKTFEIELGAKRYYELTEEEKSEHPLYENKKPD